MYINLNLDAGPDDSVGKVTGAEFTWPGPGSDGDRCSLNVNFSHWATGTGPSRAALITALSEVVEMATYGIQMLWMQAEGVETRIERLEESIEDQREKADEAAFSPEDYLCESCPDEGECPACAADAQADLARERGKLAALEQELESLLAEAEASDVLAQKIGQKIARQAAFGNEAPVTSPVTRQCAREGCGLPVSSPRPEALYCSGRCRVAAHRAEKARR